MTDPEPKGLREAAERALNEAIPTRGERYILNADALHELSQALQASQQPQGERWPDGSREPKILYVCEGCGWSSNTYDEDPSCECSRDAWEDDPPEIQEVAVLPAPQPQGEVVVALERTEVAALLKKTGGPTWEVEARQRAVGKLYTALATQDSPADYGEGER